MIYGTDDYRQLPPQNILISGPMRGRKQFNFPTFFGHERKLKNDGHMVFNPARRDTDKGFDPTHMEGTQEELDNAGFDLRAALVADTTFIAGVATAIYLLPGWSKSSGARAEAALLQAIPDTTVIFADENAAEEGAYV